MGLFGRKKQDEDEDVDVVDLRPQPVPAKLEFGMPTRCPSCSQPGYLDSIDLTEKRMYQHCPVCFSKWETTEDELTSAS